MFTYACGITTDKGDVRPENQDSILALSGHVNGQTAGLYVVADGMGGLSHGAQISSYITEQFARWWQEDFPYMVQEHMDHEEEIRELLEQEIWDINQAVLGFNKRMQCRSGSTLSLLLCYRGQYYIENIGDSRVYLLRNQFLRQLTQDQSLVAQLVREHKMTEEEARHSIMKNKLTMCIGMFPVPRSNYYSGELQDKDCFLLCSDGFYHPVGWEQMEQVLGMNHVDAKGKAEYLRQQIQPGKATDNVSAILVDVAKA